MKTFKLLAVALIFFVFSGFTIDRSAPTNEEKEQFKPILEKFLEENWKKEVVFYVDDGTEGTIKQTILKSTIIRVENIKGQKLFMVEIIFKAEFFENEKKVDSAMMMQRALFLMNEDGTIKNWDPMPGYRK